MGDAERMRMPGSGPGLRREDLLTQRSHKRLNVYLPPPRARPASGTRTCTRCRELSASLSPSPTDSSSSADAALRLPRCTGATRAAASHIAIAPPVALTRSSPSCVFPLDNARLPCGLDLRRLLSGTHCLQLLAAAQLMSGFTLQLSWVSSPSALHRCAVSSLLLFFHCCAHGVIWRSLMWLPGHDQRSMRQCPES
jgi:hypothetical protein